MKAKREYQPATKRAWGRWSLLVVALAAWAVIVHLYPVYFQRDDIDAVVWASRHSPIDCFIPTKAGAFSHDPMYRPLRELSFVLQYRLFGLNYYAWHFTLGVVFILSMAFIYKIAARLDGVGTGLLSVALWLLPFQYLLTNLFWFQDIPHVLEMMLACAGFYLFVSGFPASRMRMAAGAVVMLLSFLSKEPVIVILPTTVSVFILTNHDQLRSRKLWKTMAYAVAPLLVVPAYLALFPAVMHRQASADSGGHWVLAAVGERLFYYAGYLSSGLSLLLVVPAIYIVFKRLTAALHGTPNYPALVLISVGSGLSIAALHWYPLTLVAILAAGLLLPRRLWCLMVWAIVPIIGLCAFQDIVRSYLYEAAFGLSMLSAVFANEMARDLIDYWRTRIRWPAVTYAAGAVLVVALPAMAIPQFQKQSALLKLRSTITLNTKNIMPCVRRLPHGSVVMIIDYASLGIDIRHDITKWTDRQKLLMQSPVNFGGTRALRDWLDFNGRPDLVVTVYRTYAQHMDLYGPPRKAYLWSTTPREQEFVREAGLAQRIICQVGEGEAKATLFELSGTQ